MLPLIDIVFLLLVFFIYAMLSMAVHRGLPVELPLSATATPEKEQIISVTVQKQGGAARIYLDEEPVPLAALAEKLRQRALAAGGGDPGVLLFADRQVAYQELFRVLDQINRAGLSRISLQADAD
jgi:biopolymer transport protein ExbD